MAVVLEKLTDNQYCFYMAKLADQAERYQESLNLMEKFILNSDSDLTGDERSLFCTVYKKVINPLRVVYQTVLENEDYGILVDSYKSKLESEISKLCKRILNLLDSRLIPLASESESKVFYLKMKGDCYRYLAEFEAEAIESVMVAYMTAQKIAIAHDLCPSHPTRLGLALNTGVFYFEILHESEKAYSIAREAIDEAVDRLRNSREKTCKESQVIMQLMKDNFALWSSS